MKNKNFIKILFLVRDVVTVLIFYLLLRFVLSENSSAFNFSHTLELIYSFMLYVWFALLFASFGIILIIPKANRIYKFYNHKQNVLIIGILIILLLEII